MRKWPKRPKPPEEGSPPVLIGYARVSTVDQKLDLQLDALHAAGVDDDHLYIEKLSARAKRRPELDMAIKDIRPGDTLLVWRLDRLARNMKDLYQRLGHIKDSGGKFKSLQETFDFDTTTGQFVLGILGLVAQLESQMTQDRTTAGMKARKDRGFTLGRTPTMDAKLQDKCFAMLKAGKSVAFVAVKLKVSKATIYGYFKVTRKNGKVTITRRGK